MSQPLFTSMVSRRPCDGGAAGAGAGRLTQRPAGLRGGAEGFSPDPFCPGMPLMLPEPASPAATA
jgi:hypothetical protein